MKRGLFLLLIAATSSADCSIPAVLTKIRPGAAWSLSGETYAGLRWLDAVQVKPTASETVQAVSDCHATETSRLTLKAQARVILKDTTTTQAQKIQALIQIFDLDL